MHPVNTFIKYHGAATSSFVDSLASLGTQIRYRARARITGGSNNNLWGVADTSNFGSNSIFIRGYTYDPQTYFATCKNGSYIQVASSQLFTQDVWSILEWLYTTTAAHGYVAGTEIDSGSTSNLPTANMGLAMYDASGVGEQSWSFVSKYVSPEPAHGAWGSEVPQHSSYKTMVGTASGWAWDIIYSTDTASKVRSGTSTDWQWQTWTPNSGRKVPQGTAADWSWGPE